MASMSPVATLVGDLVEELSTGRIGRLGMATSVSHHGATAEPPIHSPPPTVWCWSMVRDVDSDNDPPLSSGSYVPDQGITMFTTTWCGYCRRLKYQLERESIPFTEVDIERHPDAADIVTEVNRGNRTVPTVLFPDGSAATNPSISEVKERLAS